MGIAFASGVGEAGLAFAALGETLAVLGAGFTGISASVGFTGLAAIAGGEVGAAGLLALGAAAEIGVYGILIYEAIKNAPPGEPHAKTIMNATIKRLGTLKKPETVGDVIAAMALMKFTKGGESGTAALQSAVDNLNNSKYAKYSGADLNAAELETFKMGKMNALEYYEKLIGKFGFTTPFDDLNQVVKYYYLLFLAQTKQGVEHLATTTPPPGVGNGKLSQYKSGTKEGFENNLQKYSIGSVTSDGQVITNRGDFLGITTDPAQMGSYGPVGWGKNRVDSKQKAPKGAGEEIVNDADLKTRKAINNLLGSDPVASTVRTGTWGQTKAQSKDKAQHWIK